MLRQSLFKKLTKNPISVNVSLVVMAFFLMNAIGGFIMHRALSDVIEHFQELYAVLATIAVISSLVAAALIYVLVRFDKARDIAEKAATEIRNDMVRILEGADSLIFITDLVNNEILFITDNWKEHFDIDGDVLGRKCYEIMHGFDKLCDFCPRHQLDVEPDKTIIWEDFHSASKRHYQKTDRYIDWPDGRKVHIQYAVDITELTKVKERAIQSDIAKSRFLAAISHDIRTPLNAIMGISTEQIFSRTLSKDLRAAFSQISKSGNLLVGIVDNLLDLSKIEAGKMEISDANYDISALINDTIRMNTLKIGTKPIDFSVNVDEAIPNNYFGDELRIKQIINNILSNSIKYTESGFIDFSVTAETQNEKSEIDLVFCITDTGRGMSEEQLNALFEEYSRFGSDTNRTIEGTGLGMHITQKLVSLMGGKISVQSKLGVGTVVTVTIPQLVTNSEILGRTKANSLQQFNYDDDLQAKEELFDIEPMPYGSALVVDDIASNIEVARNMLSLYEIEIDIAKSGQEAVEKIINGNVYDVIFLDYMMPKMDGIETLKNIRKLGYKNPVVALTAHAIVGQEKMFLENGFDGFLSKPIKMLELDAALNEFVRDRQAIGTLETMRTNRENLSAAYIAAQKSQTSIANIFVRDAEDAYVVMEKIYKHSFRRKDDIKTFLISAHAMKSVLAYMREPELTNIALELESAARKEDIPALIAATPNFLKELHEIIKRSKQQSGSSDDYQIEGNSAIDEDSAFLHENLRIIHNACLECDYNAIKNALSALNAGTWGKQTGEVLESIEENLLYGALEEIESITAQFI